jgi:hypothetical protein
VFDGDARCSAEEAVMGWLQQQTGEQPSNQTLNPMRQLSGCVSG